MLNNIVIMGRLTSDPEIKYTQSNTPVCSFSVAVERSYKSGEERITDFLSVVAWRGTAEFVGKYFGKGQLIAVEGSLETRDWTDRDGGKHRAYEINARQVHFAGAKNQEETRPAKAAKPPEPPEVVDLSVLDDDDLPF